MSRMCLVGGGGKLGKAMGACGGENKHEEIDKTEAFLTK